MFANPYIYFMKALSLLLISIILLSKPSPTALGSPSNKDSVLSRLEKKRATIDKYVYKHQKEIIVLAKVSGKGNLVLVKNENWPDNTEYSYNVLKDSTGRTIMIAEMPYSESGDWYIEYKYYFDSNGKTFAFSKRETVFDDSVNGGIAMEELFKYYDGDYKMLAQIEKLTDKDEKPIKRNKSEFGFPEYKYNIYPNVNSCLVAYYIKVH